MFRTIRHAFPWTSRTEWKWTVDDVKLLQVINDVSDVDAILPHVAAMLEDKGYAQNTGYSCCIQAGGAMGIWPNRLSKNFTKVITVEPLPENYACLLSNVSDCDNVIPIQAVLGSGQLRHLARRARDRGNQGCRGR